MLGIDVHLLADVLDDRFLVIRIVDGKVIVVADQMAVHAQNFHACGMERADPGAAGIDPDARLHTFTHLTGCFICKSNGKDVARTDPLFADQIRNAVRDDPGLARTCPCQYKKRSLCCKDRFLLLII